MPDDLPTVPCNLDPKALAGDALRRPSGGWEPPAPADLAVVLPEYEVSVLLGRGGMGADTHLRLRLAVVTIRPATAAATTQ